MSLDLTNLDSGFGESMARRPGTKLPLASARDLLKTANVFNGYYTVTFRDESHRTFRIHTQNPDARFAPNRRIISLLIGPDNTADYEMVAFLASEGPLVFKRFRDTQVSVHLDLLWDLICGERVDGCDVQVSRKCLLCNRELTDPASLARGVGPTCWERMQE